MRTSAIAPSPATQKVVIVNGNSEMLGMLEGVLDAGHYDIVFVEPGEHAYSQIRRVQPNLVVLCVHIEDPEGCRVLSMLKLDDATRSIPILTYTTVSEQPDSDDEPADPSETGMFAPQPAPRMN